ncbi:MAG: helix-turn-helix domain-containing protein, partial [Halioglobus sp.]|nr:helix-turn-helix domain-containing protein [Halioglobus sp.]
AGEAVISYEVNVSESSALVPRHWDRADYHKTVALASGLLIWHALCGWLTGESMDIIEAKVSAPYLNDEYFNSLRAVLRVDVQFGANENVLRFDSAQLERRTVHNTDSLREFLDNAVFQLISIEREPASTSAAIRSLIARDLPSRLPSFSTISGYLHMSESSLRRRLLRENTSYQNLKDEVRCQIAIDKLLNEEATVADLAEYLGFTEPSSFIRSFKSWTGDTPAAYRDKVQSLSA